MESVGLEQRITHLLEEVNLEGGYQHALLCTEQGLLVASVGDHLSSEQLAGLTSLFDDILVRARRDLEATWVDEVTLLDPEKGRLVIRPLPLEGSPRMFLVLQVPTQARWRRHTNRLTRTLAEWLAPVVQGSDDAA